MNPQDSKNDYPLTFGYTPSLYNEQDVIEEESSNYEDSQPVSDQSFGAEEQDWTAETSVGYAPFSDVDGTNESFENSRGRTFASSDKQGREYENLDDFTSVEQDFIPQYARNRRQDPSDRHMRGLGFNAETNLYEGGIEVGHLGNIPNHSETDDFYEEDEELSFPTHDNINLDQDNSKIRRQWDQNNNNGTPGDQMGDEESMTQPQSARFRQDTLDEISSASEDYFEEDLNNEPHNALQFTFQPYNNTSGVQQQQNIMQNGHQMSNISYNNTQRNLRQSDQMYEDEDLDNDQSATENFDENTSQLVSTDFSQPFPSREQRDNGNKHRNYRGPSMLFRGRSDTLDSEAGDGISLMSRNLRQPSFNAEMMDSFLRHDSVMSSDTQGGAMPVLYESDTSTHQQANTTTDRSSIPKGPSQGRSGTKQGGFTKATAGGRKAEAAGPRATTSGKSLSPNWMRRASDSEGDLSVSEDASKNQLFDKLRKEKFHSTKLIQENNAYQQQVNSLNLELANTKDILDQLRVKAHVGLDVEHPDALPGQGVRVNPARQPNRFEMPKPNRAGVINPNDNRPREDAENNPRLNELVGEAQRINSSLKNFCDMIRDGNMHASEHKKFLQNIKRDANQLKSDYEAVSAEIGDALCGGVKEMLDRELFQIDFLTGDAEHLFEEIEAQKEAQMARMEQQAMEEAAELAKSRSNLNQNQMQPHEGGTESGTGQGGGGQGPQQAHEVTRLAQEVEQLKMMYELEKWRHSQPNLVVASEMNQGVPFGFQLNGGLGRDQWAKVASSANMNLAGVRRLQGDPGVSQSQPRLNHLPFESEDIIARENVENGPQSLNQVPDWPNQDGMGDYDTNENIYYDNMENMASVFKPISTHDSSMVGESVDMKMSSARMTPNIDTLNEHWRRKNSANEPSSNNMGSLDRNQGNVQQRDSGIPRRRSSIPKLDSNFYHQNSSATGPQAQMRPGANGVSIGRQPHVIMEQRFLKGRTHFSDRPIQKTYSVDGGLGDSNASLKRKDRLGALLAANEDNDSGFVGSGPSHFGNVTSETSYSSSRGQTPATATGSLRRFKNPAVMDRKMSEPAGLGISRKEADIKIKSESGSEIGQNDAEDMESLGLESPDSSIGSIKLRPLKTSSSNKPKSSSTPKPVMASAGIQARVAASNKNSQTSSEHRADAAIGDSDAPRGSNAAYQTPKSATVAKFASPRSSAFKSYVSSSTEDNMPLRATKSFSKPGANPALNRRTSARKQLPFSRRGLVEPTEKQSAVANSSKFSKSETALETSMHNQSKIDEIEREILEIRADIEEAKNRTKRPSIVSSTPRNEIEFDRRDMPPRPGSWHLGNDEEPNRPRREDSDLENVNTYNKITRNRQRESGSKEVPVNSSSDHLCSRRLSFQIPKGKTSTATNTNFEALPSRPMRSKKLQTENVAASPTEIASSDSEEIGNVTVLESRRNSSRNKRTGSLRNPVHTNSRGTGAMSSDLDSAYDIIHRHKPRRTASSRVRNVAGETDDPRAERFHHHHQQQTRFAPIGVQTNTTEVSGSNLYYPHQPTTTTTTAVLPTVHVPTMYSTNQIHQHTAAAYVPIIGMPLIQQSATAVPHLVAQPTATLVQPQVSPAATGLWMYAQPAGLTANIAAPPAAATVLQPHHVIHAVDHVNNPMRFYYKTADSSGAVLVNGDEQVMTRSADSLQRRHSSRKYDSNGNRLGSARTYKGNGAGSSKLLQSIQSADVAARQLKRLSQNMADSVYTHLNGNELI